MNPDIVCLQETKLLEGEMEKIHFNAYPYTYYDPSKKQAEV